MRVDTVLTDLLEATAAKTAASRRIDRLRDVLDNEARRRYADEGAAPSWKAPKLGGVRLDPKPAKAYVADPDAFASYVAQRHPSEVTARLELDAAQLEAALSALEFAGITVRRSAVEVRPQFAEALLANADVLYDEQPDGTVVKAVGTVEPTSGTLELIAGTDVLAPSATLVVTLDRDRKRFELERVDTLLDAELNPAPADRSPYVGTGADGARRSAEVDRSEVDGLDRDDPRRTELLDSARRWDEQAARLEAEEHAADVGARLAASVTAPAELVAGSIAALEAGADAEYAADVRASDLRDDAADLAGKAEPTIAARQRAHAAALVERHRAEDVDSAHLGDPYAVPASDSPAPPPTEERTPAELRPLTDDEVSLGTPDPTAVAMVNAAAHAEPFEAEVEPVPGVVDELLRFTTDDLKRAARNRRVPLNGTKVLLAGRLARAGVTANDVTALRPA